MFGQSLHDDQVGDKVKQSELLTLNDQLPHFTWDFPGFSTESPMFWETPQF